MDYSPLGSSVHEGSPGKNAGVGCHALLQGIFPTQRWNPGLLHRKADSLPPEPPGKPLVFLYVKNQILILKHTIKQILKSESLFLSK